MAVALLAVVVLGWLGVMERNARLQAEGVAAARSLPAPGGFARADSALRRARVLNPDATPDVGRAAIRLATGRHAQAAAILGDVVAREPENLTAWAVLGAAARGGDPALATRALAARRRLDPLNAPR